MSAFKTYRIETERLVIRCYSPTDAPLLLSSINESIEHLRPWMPWIKSEPEDLDAKVAKIRVFRSMFDRDEDYTFGVFDKQEKTLIGSTGLHKRIGQNALEIGYWINVNYINKGFATEAVNALTKVGFAIEGLERIEIHCDSRNIASFSIPKKLGYQLEATLKNRFTDEQEVWRDKMIWTMFKVDFNNSNIKDYPITAYNILGQPISFEIQTN